MLKPPLPADEKERLDTLHGMKLLDTPIEEGFERITRLAKSLFDVPIASITLIDEQRQWFKSVQGSHSSETPRDISFCGHAILQDDFFIIPDALADDRFKDNPLVTGEPNIRFYVGCPIRAVNDKKLGTLCLIDRKPRELSKAELSSLKDLAALAEIAMKNRRISYAQEMLIKDLDQARLAALVDPLTRLWNREGITQILEYQLLKQKGYKAPFGLAILDIDFFKKVNDVYGHSAGDEVLRLVSKYLLKSCREEDAVGRLGGEEFIILINAEDEELIKSISERICTNLARMPISIGDGKTINITVTIGLTLVDPKSGIELEQFINIADEALYEGKNTGRNQVVVR